MNDKEIVKIVLNKKMAKKKREKILDELKAQGIDYAHITFKYIAEHPEEFKNYIIEMPVVELANQFVEIQNIFDGRH